MKVSAFTFIKNGQILGYPFVQSIKSILPIVDETSSFYAGKNITSLTHIKFF